MLDQNTDRMWYVIGAVLIGAAIIFGMNTMFPSAFASVGDLFSSQIATIDRKLERYGEDLLTEYVIHQHANGVLDLSRYHNHNTIGLKHWGETDGLYLKLDELGLEPNSEYVLRYSFKKTDGTLVNIGGHTDGVFADNVFYLDGVNMNPMRYQFSGDGLPWTGRKFMEDDTEVHTVTVYIYTPDNFDEVLDRYDGRIAIQPNRGVNKYVAVEIYDLELVEVF